MKTPKLPTDPLFRMEHRIAQRADELDRQFGVDPTHALEHWRQAEEEIWSVVADPEILELATS